MSILPPVLSYGAGDIIRLTNSWREKEELWRQRQRGMREKEAAGMRWA